MRFGELLKEKRAERSWTQPQACAEIGIEQSYLSKLEAGKSIPSEEVYASLAAVYGLDAQNLAGCLFPAELDRLRSIEAVRAVLLHRTRQSQQAVQRWLVAGVVALALGGALIGLAQLGHGVAVQNFSYQSLGLIRPGEPLDVFSELDQERVPEAGDAPNLLDRVDEQIRLTPDYRGPQFIETLPEGRRVWQLIGAQDEVASGPYRVALVPGMALVFLGVGCFLASWRWR